MKITKAKGRLRGKQPKLKPNQATQLLELHDSGSSAQIELAERSVSDDPRSTGPSSGCDPSPQNHCGHSHISRILRGEAAIGGWPRGLMSARHAVPPHHGGTAMFSCLRDTH